MIEIIRYKDKYQPDFKRLNLEWLDKYNLTESHDLEVLDDPQKTVIAGGGCIFLAMDGDKVIGSAGLFKMNEREYELIKMGVDPAYRRQGIGKKLLNCCLGEAGKIKAETIILYSNSQLKTALKLYEKYGFRYVTADDAPVLLSLPA